MSIKVLILNEMILGKGKYSPLNAIEAEVSEEEYKFLTSLHGRDLTEPTMKEDALIEKYLNFLYDFSNEEKPILKHKQVIHTDHVETTSDLGPYEKVFHIMY